MTTYVNNKPVANRKHISKLAIASFSLSIAGLIIFCVESSLINLNSLTFSEICFLCFLLAMITGIIALVRLEKLPNIKGKAFAIIGLVCGTLMLLYILSIVALAAIFVFVAFHSGF